MNTSLVLGGVAIITFIAVGTTMISTDVFAQRAIGSGAGVPVAISDENVYVAWWTNKSGDDEVMFRASIDAGATFGNKTNLSNTTGADSQDVRIAAEGGNVIVSWWERNQTANEPVARISTDSGTTFGDLLRLATNGTLGEAEEEE